MTLIKTIALSLAAALCLAVLAVGGYQLGWWLKEDRVERQTEIDNQRSSTQSAWRQQVNEAMRDAALLEDGPQRNAVVLVACDLIPKLTDTFMTPDIAAFGAANC